MLCLIHSGCKGHSAASEPFTPEKFVEEVLKRCSPEFADALKHAKAQPSVEIDTTVLQCPETPDNSKPSTEDKGTIYIERAEAGQCDTDKDLWQSGSHQKPKFDKFRLMAHLFGLDQAGEPNVIVDFGGGCGKELNIIKSKNKKATAMLVELAPAAVEWAKQHLELDWACAIDGGSIDTKEMFDGQSVDYVLSNGVLLSWDSREKIWEIMERFLKITKKCHWHGCMDNNNRYNPTAKDLDKAFFTEKAAALGFETFFEFEKDIFGTSEYNDDSWSIFFCRKAA